MKNEKVIYSYTHNEKVIYSYTHKEAIDDGYLVEILPHRWNKLTSGWPLLASDTVYAEISMAGIMEIWNEYVMKGGPKKHRFSPFKTKMNGKEVWVMWDGLVYTILYPSDY
jgi:hypothetical protein